MISSKRSQNAERFDEERIAIFFFRNICADKKKTGESCVGEASSSAQDGGRWFWNGASPAASLEEEATVARATSERSAASSNTAHAAAANAGGGGVLDAEETLIARKPVRTNA